MGRQGDLWDDSALINAFDDAISSFKKMHSKKSNDGLTDKGEDHVHVLAGVGDTEQATRQADTNEETNFASDTAAEVGQSSNLSVAKENHCVGPNVHESSTQGAEEVQNINSHSQGAEEYNRLLNQYYQLEEKRQKILEQLHQFGSWNYQYSGEGSGYGTYQEHSLSANQSCNPNVVCSCCPYGCQGAVAPCTSAPACCLGGPYACNSCPDASAVTDPGRSFPLEDGDIVKTAMGAAERAISSMKMKSSGDFNADEASKEEEKEKGKNERVMVQSTSSETDLSVLLNAWYSAGFYTGKYLVEQNIAKRRQN
ncbi:uncharacterized protein LOC107431355 [Ziziphus jujuba]|uniref:Uncharacterized protein LOC107431355 n=1 Tax=Ziziphus jujuba TaxID=326968 RepID=A0A6P4ANA1_ZIZJJ|nr:uncharacterized protein LOC107431355 [Ziziphus jujuba]